MAKRKKSPSKKTTAGGRKPTLASLRKQVDELDNEILAAINRRAELAQEIGQQKQADAQDVYDPQREADVIGRMLKSSDGPLGKTAVQAIYRELISATRAAQAPLRVAYLGPEFTFSHLATIHRFGQSAELVPVRTIAAVFEEVERGQVEYGVVPMENTTDGRVTDTLECFSRSPVRICGELPLRIHHWLLGNGKRDAVRTVYSKPQPLSQCRNWLAMHLAEAELQEVSSTAEAARRVTDDKHAAAIASEQAGINYGLGVLSKNIEDHPDNITRFAVISTQPADRTGNDRTALMFEIDHKPGALADSMAIFKRQKLNMTWIESFPIPGSRGRYLFFIEFVGHQGELKARRAIESLSKKAVRLEVLGSYAQTEPVG